MAEELKNYKRHMALVTGAGDGIGRMLAIKLAEAGMTVCVQDIREDAAREVSEHIGGDAFPMVFDVSDRDQCLAAAKELTKRKTPLALLWANAGVGIGAKMTEGSPRTVEWGVAVNIVAPIWTVQAFRPLMQPDTAPAHIGFTASSASIVTPDGPFPFYAVTKHGTFAVAEAIREEVAAEGIGATILCPGLLNTNIWDGAKARPDRFGGEARMDPAIARMWREAKSPDLMWPHIASVIDAGGGYLVCATEEDTQKKFEARAEAIGKAFVTL